MRAQVLATVSYVSLFKASKKDTVPHIYAWIIRDTAPHTLKWPSLLCNFFLSLFSTVLFFKKKPTSPPLHFFPPTSFIFIQLGMPRVSRMNCYEYPSKAIMIINTTSASSLPIFEGRLILFLVSSTWYSAYIWFNEDNNGQKAYELALQMVQCCPRVHVFHMT